MNNPWLHYGVSCSAPTMTHYEKNFGPVTEFASPLYQKILEATSTLH